MNRSSGILMPISSLPSPYGIGTFGKAAYDFADFLHAAGQGYWQLLPLGPTSYGDSPYQSFSTFAGNPYFIDLDLLIKDKLLTRKEVTSCAWGSEPRYVDYGKIYESRFALLERAKARGWERDREAVAAFEAENSRWLPDYALFMALKRHFGMKSWTEWPDEGARLHRADALERYRAELRGDVELFTYIQFLFFRQWSALKSYINGLGIRIIGDIPIYVAMDSSDVWSEPEKFQLDERNVPVEVSGVPPDYFSADGQLWGNPLYDYEAMQKDGFEWWIRRIGGAAKLYDVIRIDHFRGFESYWAVPYGETTAKNGRWVKGPGMSLGGVLTDRIGARRVCLVGGLMLSAGAVPMCFLDAASPLWQAVVFQGVRACGVSLLIGPLTQWSLADLPRPLVPHGSSLSIAVRQACASFGTSAMVLAISVGQGIASRGGLADGLRSAPDLLAALPYHLAFGFSAVLSLCLLAVIAWKVR